MYREWNMSGSAGRVPARFLTSLKDCEVIGGGRWGEQEGRVEKKGECNTKGL